MAGFFRNFLTVFGALLGYGEANPGEWIIARFRITPLDTGFSKLKSDKYLHLTESAQIDFFIRTKLAGIFIKNGYAFVNLAQLVKFSKPVQVFSQVKVSSHILYWDHRIVYFEHVFSIDGNQHARVLVKTKFKRGGKTIDPNRLIGLCDEHKPQFISDWDNAVNAL